jgi:hypothetical protein
VKDTDKGHDNTNRIIFVGIRLTMTSGHMRLPTASGCPTMQSFFLH